MFGSCFEKNTHMWLDTRLSNVHPQTPPPKRHQIKMEMCAEHEKTAASFLEMPTQIR